MSIKDFKMLLRALELKPKEENILYAMIYVIIFTNDDIRKDTECMKGESSLLVLYVHLLKLC